MKKTICCILTFILLITTCSALAQTDKEILFRGVPWGSTIKEAKMALAEDIGTMWSFASSLWSCSAGYYIDNANTALDIVHEYDTYTSQYIYPKYASVQVAGHTTDDVYLIFAALPDENNRIIFDSKNNLPATSFYRAQYILKSPVEKGLTKELVEKLTGLYGEPDEEKSEKRITVDWTTYIWNGANNSFCALVSQVMLEKDTIFLIYGTYDGDELIETANQILLEQKRQREEEQKKNTDGL